MIRVVTLFSGYDSQCLALRRLGIDFDLVAWCEIDEDARRAHDVLFPEYANRNIGDISRINWDTFMEMRKGPAIDYFSKQYVMFADEPTDTGDEQVDLLTYSSPCQDFSIAGFQAGAGGEGEGIEIGFRICEPPAGNIDRRCAAVAELDPVIGVAVGIVFAVIGHDLGDQHIGVRRQAETDQQERKCQQRNAVFSRHH